MHTYLIVSRNQNAREAYAVSMSKGWNIHDLDLIFLEKEGSIGIEDVRNFQKQLMLKPIKSIDKAAIIKNAHNITIEAQNALLKTLEEPPNHTYVFLTAETGNTLLPTILSRTSIITLKNEGTAVENVEQITLQLDTAISGTVGDKLKLAETLSTNKETSLQWLESAIHVLRNTMLEQTENASAYIAILESLQQTYTTIKTTNVNLRFTLEILFLTI